MTIATAKLSGAGRRGSAWRLIVGVVLLAFTLQSYFTQTHTHDPSQSLSSTATLNLLAKAPADRKAPTDNSPSNCAFCQAIAHAGIFFTPATLPLLPALSAECEATAVAASVLAGAVFRYWQSRAPPQR